MCEHENTADANTHGHKKNSLAAVRNRHTETHTTYAQGTYIHRYGCTLQQHRTRAEMGPGTLLMLIHNQTHTQPQTCRSPTETQCAPGHTDRHTHRGTHTHFLPKQTHRHRCTSRPACTASVALHTHAHAAHGHPYSSCVHLAL